MTDHRPQASSTALTRREALGLGVAALALPGLAIAQQTATPAGPRLSVDQARAMLPWQELRGGVWFLDNSLAGGNFATWVCGDEAVVIDTKSPTISETLYECVRARTETITVFNTHYHVSHPGGNVSFKNRSRMIATAPAWPGMRGAIERYLGNIRSAPGDAATLGLDQQARVFAQRLQSRDADAGPLRWAPDLLLSDSNKDPDRTIRVGDRRLSLVIPGAAHTNADLVIHDPEANVLAVGDLVFSGLHPYASVNDSCSVLGWIQTLGHLERTYTDAQTVVIPGKGAAGGPELLTQQRVILERYVEIIEDAIRSRRNLDSYDLSFVPEATERFVFRTFVRAVEAELRISRS